MEDEIGGFLVNLNKKDKNNQPLNKSTKEPTKVEVPPGDQIVSDATAANSSGNNSK